MLLDVGAVDFHRYHRIVAAARVETDILEQELHNGVQSSRADVLAREVDVLGDLRDRLDGIGRELQVDVVDRKQNRVLLRERVLGAR